MGIGPILTEAIEAGKILKEQGIDMAIASMGSVKPLDQKFILDRIKEGFDKLITLEEHHIDGGLGTTVLELLSEHQIHHIKLKRMGISDHFIHKLGSQNYVRETEGLNASAIVSLVQSL